MNKKYSIVLVLGFAVCAIIGFSIIGSEYLPDIVDENDSSLPPFVQEFSQSPNCSTGSKDGYLFYDVCLPFDITHLDIDGDKIASTWPEETSIAFRANEADAVSIDQLVAFQDLEVFLFGNRAISDFSPLGEITSLRHIQGNANGLSDFSFLSTLVELRFVSLQNTSATDISPLSGLSNLENLWLNSCRVENLEPLSALDKLESLEINSCPVSDIIPLARLSSLSSLQAMHTNIRDVSPLSELQNLTGIRLDGSPVTNLSPLQNIANLYILVTPSGTTYKGQEDILNGIQAWKN